MSQTFQKILLCLCAIGTFVSIGIHGKIWGFQSFAIELGQMIFVLTILLCLLPLVGIVIWRNLIKKHLF